jgi:hypothetical protein
MLQRRANVEAAVAGLIAALVVFFVGWVAVRFVLLALVAVVGTTPFAAGGSRATAVLLAAAASVGVLVAVRRRPAPQQAEP